MKEASSLGILDQAMEDRRLIFLFWKGSERDLAKPVLDQERKKELTNDNAY